MVPINRMVPRSFFTNLAEGSSFPAGKQFPVRGIAFGGDRGVAKVKLSSDGGKSWQPAMLGKDYGKYRFRQWQTNVALATKGDHALYGDRPLVLRRREEFPQSRIPPSP